MKVMVDKRKISGFLSFLFVLLPIFNIYDISMGTTQVNIGMVALMLISVYSIGQVLLKDKMFRLCSFEMSYLLFWLYSFFVAGLTCLIYNFSIPVPYMIRIIMMLSCLIFFQRKVFHLSVAINVYKVVALVASVLLYIQAVVYYTGGVRLYFIPQNMIRSVRFSSVFLEPAHLCNYIAPILIITLIGIQTSNKKHDIFLSVVYSIAIIMAQSSTGFVYLCFAWGMWFLSNRHKENKLYLKIFVFIVLAALAFIIWNNFDWLKFSIDHLLELDGTSITSGNFRLLRGFAIYGQLSMPLKLFGVGAGMHAQSILKFNIRTIYDGLHIGQEYMSALSQICVMSGLVGIGMYAFHLIFCFRKSSLEVRSMIILFLIMISSNENLHSASIMLLVIFIFAFKNKEQSEIFKKYGVRRL